MPLNDRPAANRTTTLRNLRAPAWRRPAAALLVSPDAVFGVVGGPAATIPVPVPFAPVLVGLQFFNQAVSFDSGANALGLTVSNGTRATIGWQ